VRLRQRVFRYVVTAAAVSCALTVGVAIVLVRHEVARQRLAALERQADLVSAVGGAPGVLRPGEHVYLVGGGRLRRVGAARQALILAAVPDPRRGQGQINVAGLGLLYAARSTQSGGVVLVRANRLAFAEWRPFLWSLLLAGAGGALIAALVSWLLARRLAGPIDELAVATRRLAAGEPGVAVPATGTDELAELGRSFNHLTAELAAAKDTQQRFLESVSHELKTPLTSIQGYAEALSDEAVDQHQAAEVIRAEAKRLERLVSDLLDLARLQRAGFAIEPTEVDLADVAGLVVQRYRNRADSLQVSLEVAGDHPAPAFADSDRLVQAISNLVENALHVTPSGGRVTVTVHPGAVIVRDTGPGIPAEDLPRAFERFYLHERYRTDRPVGSGLGLAIVSELAQQMGGAIKVESESQAGTAFTLTLPSVNR
jgi:two-component system sensor histidine kinase BaeS